MSTPRAFIAFTLMLFIDFPVGGSVVTGAESDMAMLVQLQPGDIVLRRGSDFWSNVFARLNPHDRRFSHAGIVVRTKGDCQVVHAEAVDVARAGFVRLDPWEAFTAGASSLAVLRPAHDSIGARTADAALGMYSTGLPFDFDFDLTSASAVYCTELVWRALTAALGRDPLPVKPVVHGREAILIESLLRDMPELRPVAPLEDEPVCEPTQASTGNCEVCITFASNE